MNTNQDIFDSFVRHQLFLQRLGNQQARDILKTIGTTQDDLVAVLYTAINSITENGVLTKSRAAKYKQLLTKVEQIRGAAFEIAFTKYIADLDDFIGYELGAVEAIFKKEMPIQLKYTSVSSTLLASRLLSTGIFNGYTLQEYFTKLSTADSDRILLSVKQGIANGTSTEGIVRSITGSSITKGRDGILNATSRGIRSMVRTTLLGVGTQTRQAWAEGNADIAPTIIYTAVLDGRTTPICASLDGTYFPVTEGPFPPLHINCRSIRVPVVDLLANNLIGTRPYVRDTRTGRFRQKDFRAEAKAQVGTASWKKMTRAERNAQIASHKSLWSTQNIGTVDANKAYTTWFSEQPAVFQRSYLGPTKYKAYKDGASLDEFVGVNGNFLSLASLKEKGVL